VPTARRSGQVMPVIFGYRAELLSCTFVVAGSSLQSGMGHSAIAQEVAAARKRTDAGVERDSTGSRTDAGEVEGYSAAAADSRIAAAAAIDHMRVAAERTGHWSSFPVSSRRKDHPLAHW